MSTRGPARFAAGVKDLVDTPPEPVAELVPHLVPGQSFIEPCAGAYKLAGALERAGFTCVDAFDVAPRDARVRQGSALDLVPEVMCISNPPYSRNLALPIMTRAAFTWPVTSWWLVRLAWLTNSWCAPFLETTDRIVPVGRVSWVRTETGGPTGSGYESSMWIRLGEGSAGVLRPRYATKSGKAKG